MPVHRLTVAAELEVGGQKAKPQFSYVGLYLFCHHHIVSRNPPKTPILFMIEKPNKKSALDYPAFSPSICPHTL